MTKLNVTFTGDLCISGNYLHNFNKGSEIFSTDLKQLFRSQDAVVTNLEGPIVDQPGLIATNPEVSIAYLNERNISNFILANNHILDAGEKGLSKTLNDLNKAEAQFTGAGMSGKEACEILFISLDDLQIAILAVADLDEDEAQAGKARICTFNEEKLLRQKIKEAKEQADHVILVYHGGEEFTKYPMLERRKLLRKMTSWGMDAIVCHHSHVLQGMEEVHGVPIFYSLGNFVFDIPQHHGLPGTDSGGLLNMTFDKNSYSWEMNAVHLNRQHGMVELSEATGFDQLSDFSNYKKNWLKEAHRVFWATRASARMKYEGQGQKGTSKDNESKPNPFSKLVTLWKLWKNRNSRPLLKGAVLYTLLKPFFGK